MKTIKLFILIYLISIPVTILIVNLDPGLYYKGSVVDDPNLVFDTQMILFLFIITFLLTIAALGAYLLAKIPNYLHRKKLLEIVKKFNLQSDFKLDIVTLDYPKKNRIHGNIENHTLEMYDQVYTKRFLNRNIKHTKTVIKFDNATYEYRRMASVYLKDKFIEILLMQDSEEKSELLKIHRLHLIPFD